MIDISEPKQFMLLKMEGTNIIALSYLCTQKERKESVIHFIYYLHLEGRFFIAFFVTYPYVKKNRKNIKKLKNIFIFLKNVLCLYIFYFDLSIIVIIPFTWIIDICNFIFYST